MAFRWISTLLLALAALGAAKANAEQGAVRASELLGERVVGRQGDTLGEIVEVQLDVRTNGVHYVELARGDGGSRFAYPVNALRRAGDALRLNVPAERLDSMPGNTLPEMRYVAAQRILGSAVEDPLGNRAGTLVDLAIDEQSGHTSYFVVEFDASGERLRLPAHDLRLQPGGNPVLQADRTRRG